jgi:hypothetical protein
MRLVWLPRSVTGSRSDRRRPHLVVMTCRRKCADACSVPARVPRRVAGIRLVYWRRAYDRDRYAREAGPGPRRPCSSNPYLGIDDIDDAWASSPLFYRAKPPAHWLMCAEVGGRLPMVPLAPARSGDPGRCRPILRTGQAARTSAEQRCIFASPLSARPEGSQHAHSRQRDQRRTSRSVFHRRHCGNRAGRRRRHRLPLSPTVTHPARCVPDRVSTRPD